MKISEWHFMIALGMNLAKARFTGYGLQICWIGCWKFHILKVNVKIPMKAIWNKSKSLGSMSGGKIRVEMLRLVEEVETFAYGSLG